MTWLYRLIVTSGHAGMPSVSCFRNITQAVNMSRMGLQWVMEHEALDAFSFVLGVCMSTAPRLGQRSTFVAETLGRTCVHGVLCARDGLYVRTPQVGNVRVAVWQSSLRMATCTAIMAGRLEAVVRDRRCLEQT